MSNPNDPAQGELVPEDDAIIGSAIRWSLIALAVIAASIGAFVMLRPEDSVQEVALTKDAGRIADLKADEESLPAVNFRDVTLEAGIDFVHQSGAQGEKLLPETMGGGVAFFDADNDGDQDLFFVNGSPWPHAGEAPPGNRFYTNDGSGNFKDATASSGLAGDGYGVGVATADYDGDGLVDVFTSAVGANHLYRNLGGHFEDVTAQAGVAGSSDQWSTSAGFFDSDGDGDLDLFVCRYVQWSRAIDEQLAFTLNGTDRAYGPPMNYAGTYSSLYRNNGDGTFSDVSDESGILISNSATGAPMGKALGVSFIDVNRDGAMDIAVANDTVQNHLFINNGDGTFEEQGGQLGFGFDSDGRATGAMGIDTGDFRGNGGIGIGVANFANEMSSLYVRSENHLYFSDDSIGEGLGAPSREKLSFGLFFFDYDLDGRLDLLQVNGHLEEAINEVQASQYYLQAPQLFWNAGPEARSCYTQVPESATGDLAVKLAGRGSAYADIDLDGDLDLILTQSGRRPVLLRNEQSLGHNWLRIRLMGRAPNTDAAGAQIIVRTPEQSLHRTVSATKSYLSQSELPVTLGLGKGESIESIQVIWPNGDETTVAVPTELNRELIVSQ